MFVCVQFMFAGAGAAAVCILFFFELVFNAYDIYAVYA